MNNNEWYAIALDGTAYENINKVNDVLSGARHAESAKVLQGTDSGGQPHTLVFLRGAYDTSALDSDWNRTEYTYSVAHVARAIQVEEVHDRTWTCKKEEQSETEYYRRFEKASLATTLRETINVDATAAGSCRVAVRAQVRHGVFGAWQDDAEAAQGLQLRVGAAVVSRG